VAIDDSGMRMISDVISEILEIPCSALMGANLAGEVAEEQFCETTIGMSLFLHAIRQ
jgi:glycerol-3-phosphate dehydrogenase (NAD+)